MKRGPDLNLIGCILDPDERHEAILEKRQAGESGPEDNPFEQVISGLKHRGFWQSVSVAESVEVPDWLKPFPGKAIGGLEVGHFVSFVDGDGLRSYSEKVGKRVEAALPRTVLVVAVDHSIAGGAMKAISTYYGPGKVTFIVLDSHTDAIPVSSLLGAIAYDMRTNPKSPFDPEDPYLKDRKDSYNTSSFLLCGIEEGWILPENLLLIGPSDLPPKRAYSITDEGVRRYVKGFARLKGLGVKIVEKRDLLSGNRKLRGFLGDIKTPYLYVSVDLDIGANNAVKAVRFRDRMGLNRGHIMGIVREMRALLEKGKILTGMDITEFNPRVKDKGVYDLSIEIILNLLSG